MNPVEEFQKRNREMIEKSGRDETFRQATMDWFRQANSYEYSYHFEWLGRPIIQYPQDIVAFQEIVWRVQPDLIIETGIAHGGSLILSASLLALLDYCEASTNGTVVDPRNPKRKVIGIDIDIRAHNRSAIEQHPMASRIEMLQGSSVAPEIVSEVHRLSQGFKKVLVCLDSNHTHEHVLAELHAYAPLVSKDSYCIVYDTVIEDLPKGSFPTRPWDKGDNPKTAVYKFLKTNPQFVVDESIDHKIQISVAPHGWLRRVE